MSNLLIKITKKVRKNKRTQEEEVSYQTELEGVVNKTYKFQGGIYNKPYNHIFISSYYILFYFNFFIVRIV